MDGGPSTERRAVSAVVRPDQARRVPKRDELRAFLKEKGVGTEVYYPLPMHLQNCYRELGHEKGSFPLSERAAAEVMSIPIYPELTEAQQGYVVETIAEFYRRV